MKITCDRCNNILVIPDKTMEGKTFKVRCRACGHILVVEGSVRREPSIPQKVPQRAAWYLVIDGEAVGPMPTSEVFERFVDGDIDALTYIWRAGFEDYVEIWRINEFDALTGHGRRK